MRYKNKVKDNIHFAEIKVCPRLTRRSWL